jgi:hypothetical protein
MTSELTVEVTASRLGLLLESSPLTPGLGACVTGFTPVHSLPGAVEASGVPLHSQLLLLNGTPVVHQPTDSLLHQLHTLPRPLQLTFSLSAAAPASRRRPLPALLPSFGLATVDHLRAAHAQGRAGLQAQVQATAGGLAGALLRPPSTPTSASLATPLLARTPHHAGAPATISSLRSPAPLHAQPPPPRTPAGAGTLDARRHGARARATPLPLPTAHSAAPGHSSQEAQRLREEVAALRARNRAAKARLLQIVSLFRGASHAMSAEEQQRFDSATLDPKDIAVLARLCHLWDARAARVIRVAVERHWLAVCQLRRALG